LSEVSLFRCSSKRTEQIQAQTKIDIKTLTNILTGHCDLNCHMHKMVKFQEETCRLFMEDSKTAQIILCEYSATARVRLKHFEKHFQPTTGHLSSYYDHKVIDCNQLLQTLVVLNQ
jgi:hypothetical protein